MASPENTKNKVFENGDHIKLDKLLKERQSPKPSRDRIVKNSHEKFNKNRQNSADASCLSRSEKERKLDDFLKHKHRRGRKSVTRSDVRAQAAKILEEFLQVQLEQQAIQTSSPEYQRIVEISVTENTTPSGESSSFRASSSNVLREDSIPYADESDVELKKSESVPHEDFVEFQGSDHAKGLPIHHQKSKSAPHSQNEDTWIQRHVRKPPGIIRPPPPPPPGTPHSPSENGSSGSTSRLHPVPYTGKTPDSSIPCSSDSLDTNSSLGRQSSPHKKGIPTAPESVKLPTQLQSHSHSTTPITDNERSHGSPTKHSQRFVSSKPIKPGSETSSDTDSEGKHRTHGRKKKSMFKKAQHRVQHFLRLKKHRAADSMEDEEDGYEGSVDEKKRKHKKKPKKHDNEKHDDGKKVLEERHTHMHKHIYQTHSGGDGKNILRHEDVTETVDIINSKERKHIEKKWKMKESTGSESGFLGKLKRLASHDKGKKNRMTGSKSANLDEDEADTLDGAPNSYDSHAISLPQRGHSRPTRLGLDETDDAKLTMYTNRRGFEFTNVEDEDIPMGGRRLRATQVMCREEKDKDIRRHSSHLDIVDHSGNMIERLYFDADGKELPKNESFIFRQEENIHERVIDEHGRIKVVRDVTHHDHMELMGEAVEGAEKNLEEKDKEELYGKIASRLASIGDNLMAEKEDLSRSASSSSKSKLTDDQKSSPEQEIEQITLTPLEIELRDELRKIGDDMDAKLAASARQAALQISGLVTYNHFKNIVQDSVSQEQGWAQIAAVFKVTKRVIRLAGASGAMAMQIKEMSLQYIEDTFAGWIVGQGGWEGMLSDAESETDSELD